MGTQTFISASGSESPCPCEPQTQLWTLKTEGHSHTVTLKKQTAHLYYWFQVTTVFLDDFNDTFSACLRGFISWKMSWNFNIFLSWKTLLCPDLHKSSTCLYVGQINDFLREITLLVSRTVYPGWCCVRGQYYTENVNVAYGCPSNILQQPAVNHCGGTGISGLMRGLATLPSKVDPGAFSGQRWMEDPKRTPWQCTASVCVAGVHCWESPWGKQIQGTWSSVCSVDLS